MKSKKIPNPQSQIPNPTSAFEKMDRMYRHQRYFYDLTRKYYLFGRDLLLGELNVSENEHILEAGCGTGRNLLILAKKHPAAHFFGLDASAAMLETARRKVDSKNLRNISLKKALADDFDFRETFGLVEPFDKIFFSYSISMIPPWKKAIQNALENLKPGKSLFIVDFYDQRDLPAPLRKLLTGWLRQFHVKYPEDLIPYLETLEKEGAGTLAVKSIYKSYSFIAEFKKK